MRFLDRRDAGRELAERLGRIPLDDPVVLGVPRGGVPVAATVASTLDAPFDVVPVRGIGVPFQPRVVLGALGADGLVVFDEHRLRLTGAGDVELAALEHRHRRGLERSMGRYRLARPSERLLGRTAVVVDDGAVGGSTARVACRAARARGAARVVLALPACPSTTHLDLRAEADAMVVLERSMEHAVVGESYHEFEPVDDDQVVAALEGADTVASGSVPDMEPVVDLWIPTGASRVAARLVVPPDAERLIVFAHAGASGRHDSAGRRIARRLRARGFATALVDLLSAPEELRRDRVHDVDLLRARLTALLRALRDHPVCRGLPVGLLADRTAVPAAMAAAAGRREVVAVVSWVGRADLLGHELGVVRAPTLFLVDERDAALVELTRATRARVPAPTRVVTLPGCGDRLSAPALLDEVADLAGEWCAATPDQVAVTAAGRGAVDVVGASVPLLVRA